MWRDARCDTTELGPRRGSVRACRKRGGARWIEGPAHAQPSAESRLVLEDATHERARDGSAHFTAESLGWFRRTLLLEGRARDFDPTVAVVRRLPEPSGVVFCERERSGALHVLEGSRR